MPMDGGTHDKGSESMLDAVKRRLTKKAEPSKGPSLNEDKAKDFVKSFKDSLGG